ncbi:MAG: ABC transporter substrate-binding protein [Gammaproteobacteria bacterium]|nr:ABC transporter substrate-binding protein [Gammaproteobacteria bacterium]
MIGFKRVACLFVFLFSCLSSAYALSSPVDMLEDVSSRAINQLKAHQATLKTNPAVVYRIINQILLPHAAMEDMARVALGRSAWGKATPAQRILFVKEFTQLMVNTYSSALAAYTDETIQFYPLRGGYQNKTRVQVDSVVIRESGPSLSVKYRLVLKGGQWKVYDISVEGVSILESFRSQFADELSQGDLDDLLQKLQAHNGNNS